MEPMDYTMDEHANQQSNTPQRNACQQPQFSPTASPFSSQIREGHRYDPVHDSSAWYHSNSSVPTRSPYAPPNTSQWTSSFMPMNSWGGNSDPHRHTGNGSAHSTSRSLREGYDSLWSYPPHYPHHTLSISNNQADFGSAAASGLSQTGSLTSGPQAIPSSNYPSYHRYGEIPYHQQRMQARDDLLAAESARRIEAISAGEAYAHRHDHSTQSPDARADSRAIARRINSIHRNNMPPEHTYPRRRNAATTWDSDEDEEDIRAETYRRQAELLFVGGDEDRAMQLARGVLGAHGKRVPSKDALASLESVRVEDLPADSKDCKICYNDYGIENPEGIIEQPLRLPKCKHIFGNKCIKKWFEDNDSCPYCRDKLPSELAVRRQAGFEVYRQARERAALLNASHRARHIVPHTRPPVGTDESGPGRLMPQKSHSNINAYKYRSSSSILAEQRLREEYELSVARSSEWTYSPSSRASGADSSERRRQARGRVGSQRAAQLLSRPTSVGSARALSGQGYPNASQRTNALVLPPVNPFSPNTLTQVQRPVTPTITRQDSGSSSSSVQTPERNAHIPSGLFSSPSSGSEAASPPVAIGSGPQARDLQARQADRHPENNRLSLDAWTSLVNAEPHSLAFHGQAARAQPHPGNNAETRGASGPTPSIFGVESPLRQHPMAGSGVNRLSSDSFGSAEDEPYQTYIAQYASQTDSNRWSR